MRKVEKVLLCLSAFLTILLGILIANISNVFYRFKRNLVFIETNEIVRNYCLEMQDRMIFIWIVLGVAIVSLVVLSARVLRKKN